MDNSAKKEHWEAVYATKNPGEVSWTQEIPQTSLDLIASFNLRKDAKIIDVGGGDSTLVDHLLELGFENVTVLDISAKALEKAQKRLGDKAGKVTWIVSDVTAFQPDTFFDVWHDRAAFHFLTTEEQVALYRDIARRAVRGFMIIGTFSENGPVKCSGLEIQQYTEVTLTDVFDTDFKKVYCLTQDHMTPFHTSQNFLFCTYQRRVNPHQ